MKWKNLKIATKLTLAFGTIILLLILFGGISYFNFINIDEKASSLSDEYIPMSIISNNITSSAGKVVMAEQNFSATLEKNYLDEGQKYLDSLKTYLRTAREMTENHASLETFKSIVEKTEKTVADYEMNISTINSKASLIILNKSKAEQLKNDFYAESKKYVDLQKNIVTYEIANGTKPYVIGNQLNRITAFNIITNKAIEGFELLIDVYTIHLAEKLPVVLKYFNEVETQLTSLQASSRGEENIQLGKVKNKISESKTLTNENIASFNEIKNALSVDVNLSNQSIADFESVSSQSLDKSKSNAGDTKEFVYESKNAVIIGLVFTIIMAIFFAFLITRSVSKSIKKGVAFAKQVSEGNLEAKIDISQKDEIGDLAEALKSMIVKLNDIICEVLEGANAIANASLQISHDAQSMAQGANEQAASAQEVSSSMEQMVSNIQQNSDNSRQTEIISIKAAESIKNGSKTTLTAVNSMKQIAEKISIINDIAFQTNILALNAAVEAARAGEHGRGFAVVAAEVRKLAERSKIAAEEIDELSKSGVSVSEAAGAQLENIVPEIEKTAKLIQEIASASKEQNTGAEQINSAIQQLNLVTQQNAATSENMAANAEHLSNQAERLKNIIAFFAAIKKNVMKEIKKPVKQNTIIKQQEIVKVAKNKTEPKEKTEVYKNEAKIEEKKSEPSKQASKKTQQFQQMSEVKKAITIPKPIKKGAFIDLTEKNAKTSDDKYERF